MAEEERNRILRAKSSFEVLKVTPKSSREDIKKAYKKAALAVHPDKNPDSTANEAFNKVQKAYSDIEKCKDFADNPFLNFEDAFSSDQSGIYSNFLSMWQEFLQGKFDHLLNIAELVATREHIDVEIEDLRKFLQFFHVIVSWFNSFLLIFGNDLLQLYHCVYQFTEISGVAILARLNIIFIFFSVVWLIPAHLAQNLLPCFLGVRIAPVFIGISQFLKKIANKCQ